MRTSIAPFLCALALAGCEPDDPCDPFEPARGCPCDEGIDCTAGDVCTRAGVCAESFDDTPAVQLTDWRWDFPSPTGQRVRDVAGASPDDVWAVGEAGLLLHGDGVTWSVVDGGLADLTALDAAAGDDVWAVGVGSALHWDGAAWTETAEDLSPPVLVDVWAAGDGRAIALAGFFERGDRLLAFDGAWTEVARLPAGHFGSSVSGTRDDDLWILAERAPLTPDPLQTLLQWNGANFVTHDVGERRLAAVFGASPADVTAIATDGAVGTWDGSAWTFVAPEEPELLTLSAGRALDGTIWALTADRVIASWDGQRWTALTEAARVGPGEATSGWVATADAAFGILDDGTVALATRAGALGTWQSPWRFLPSLNDVAALDDEAWAVGVAGTVAHWDGAAWDVVAISDEPLHAIAKRGAGDLWIAAERAVLHGDGTSFSRIALPLEHARLLELWVPPEGDVWGIGLRLNDADNEAIGSFVVRGGDDGLALVHESDERMRAIWGRGRDDVFIAGAKTLRRFDGEQFVEVLAFIGNPDLGASRFIGVSDDDAWLVGADGLLLHFDGEAWRNESLGTHASFRDGWAAGADDVWLLGSGSTLAHWDGTAWTRHVALPGSFHAVEGGRDTMWLVGFDGFLAHRPSRPRGR